MSLCGAGSVLFILGYTERWGLGAFIVLLCTLLHCRNTDGLPMNQRIRSAWLTLLLIQSFPELKASNHQYRGGNLREACRKEAAGIFLQLQNDMESSRDHIRHLKKKIGDLKQELVKTQKLAKSMSIKMEKIWFNMSLLREKMTLEHRLLRLKETLQEGSELLKKYEKNLLRSRAKLTHYQKKLKTIFRVKKRPSRIGRYRFELSYRRKCPPYQDSCPLTRDEAKKLLGLFAPDRTPEICQQYAKVLRW